METFFMNSKNSKTSEPNRIKYDLIDKLHLKDPSKNMALGNLSIYYTWKNVKSTYNNNKFEISAPTWNETNNTISLSRHEQVCLMRLRFERCFSHHRAR